MGFRRSIVLAVATVLVVVAAGGSAAMAAGQVRLELVGDAPGAGMAFQEWARTLSKAGIRNVRIRSGSGAEVGIQSQGSESSPIYVVTGVVKSRDELVLPGGRYRQSDAARLAAWLDDLAKHGPIDRREPVGAFGLTSEQFAQLKQDLAAPVDFATEGVARGTVVDKIARGGTIRLKADADVARALENDPVAEQLQGMSLGSALAYVLRPAGYCLVVRPGERGPTVGITKARQGLQVWPVGWEPEETGPKTLPALYEFHNVNIQNVSAAKAIEAIGKILKVPVLIDHNALARHGIDPTKAIVSYPRSRTTYGLVLRQILFQAKLKHELRIDEAGKPLLWITTLKPV